AHTKDPRSRLHCEDMRTFTLGRTFDAVTCMFGSVGYTRDEEELNATVERFALHTRPGGVVVVEPWWFPEHFTDGYVAGDLSQEEGRTITRVSYSTRRGNTTVMRVHFTVADASGIQEFTEVDRSEERRVGKESRRMMMPEMSRNRSCLFARLTEISKIVFTGSGNC